MDTTLVDQTEISTAVHSAASLAVYWDALMDVPRVVQLASLMAVH